MALYLQNVLTNPVVGQNIVLGTGGITLGDGSISTPTLAINGSVAPGVTLRRSSVSEWSIQDLSGNLRLVDTVNSRVQVALTPGAAGLAFVTFLDQVRVQAGAGQTAGQLAFYASDGTTLQASLIGDAANTLAIRNGTNPQRFNLYKTYTDASNYESLIMYWSGNVAILQTDNAGTGATRVLQFGGAGFNFNVSGLGNKWSIDSSGKFLAGADNVTDIGASGATRPRTGYFGTSVVAPVFTANVGGSTGTMNGHGTANTQTSAAGVGNGADATDDILFAYTLPVNALNVAGKSLRVRAWGTFAATANTKEVKLWFAGTALVDSGVLTLSGKNWTVEYELTAISATKVSTIGSFAGDTASVQDVTVNANLTVADLTANTSVIKVTGASTVTAAANDVLGYGLKVWFED